MLTCRTAGRSAISAYERTALTHYGESGGGTHRVQCGEDVRVVGNPQEPSGPYGRRSLPSCADRSAFRLLARNPKMSDDDETLCVSNHLTPRRFTADLDGY